VICPTGVFQVNRYADVSPGATVISSIDHFVI